MSNENNSPMLRAAPAPVRTAEEQALVDAWQSRPRLQRSPRFKEGEAPGTIVPDTQDVPLWSARVEKALGVDDPWMAEALMNQAANCVGGGPAQAPNVAIASIHSIGPRDGVEAMLAVQMTATHAAAMQMLHRAVRGQPSFEIYDSIVNRATKLLRTYAAQVEALKRYRSAGEQRVVVQHQHVNVTADQAAVQVNGDADPALRGRGAVSKPEERSHEQQLAHASEPAMRCPEPARNAMPVTSCDGASPLSAPRRR
jgi:proteasome lid subunit RPN8/RPN11